MVLIRPVLSFIPIYKMSVNVFVKKKLHRLFSRFIWGGSVDKHKMYLVNWDTVIALVIQEGLGILDLENMNKALAIK